MKIAKNNKKKINFREKIRLEDREKESVVFAK